MDKEQIKSKIVEVLRSYSKDKAFSEDLADDLNLVTDLNINSSRLVDLTLAFEDEFDIEIEDEEIGRATTIGQLIQLIDKKLGDLVLLALKVASYQESLYLRQSEQFYFFLKLRLYQRTINKALVKAIRVIKSMGTRSECLLATLAP